MKVTVPFVDEDICNEIYIHTFGKIDDNLPDGIVGEWMFCAGKHGKDTCKVNWSKTQTRENHLY